MGSILFKAFMGGLAAFAAWAITEPFKPAAFTSSWTSFELRLIVTLGIMVGITLGGIGGWIQGSRVHLIRGVILGAIFGAIGAVTGYTIGGNIVAVTFGPNFLGRGGLSPGEILARIIALTPVGLLLGAGIGFSTLNWRRAMQGAIGGTIAAFAGGAVFDILSSTLAPFTVGMNAAVSGTTVETGAFGRALYCLLIGFGVGLFIGIVELISKVAWVRLVLGRNEGKEWVVDSPHFVIGRSETASLPLFGDPAVAANHATIVRQQGSYFLFDGGSPIGTYVNGQRVQQVPLFHGAEIGIAGYRLQFLMKVGSAPQKAAEALRAQQAYGSYPSPMAAPQPVPYGGATAAMQPAPMPTQAMPSTPQPTQVVPAYSPPQPTQMVPAMPMESFTLVAVSGPMAGQRFPIVGPLEIGREGMGVSVAFDTSASRKHASVNPMVGGVQLTDLGSTNGTFVNDQRVPSAILRKGDTFRIGVTTFQVE